MHWHHWTAMAAAKRLGMKLLVRAETTSISSPRGALKKNVQKAFFVWLRRIADRFLAIGTLNAAYYRQQGVPSERIFLMPYAVDNAFFRARAADCAGQREALRDALGLAPGRPVILYAGKMIARKSPRDLLEAYATLSVDGRSEPCPYLLYVGDGEMRRELETAAAGRGWSAVRFLGFRNQTEMPAFYDLCDVFVMPSTIEPWGLVVNEAMNAGKAIITSDRVGCAPDLVRNGGNGFIFKAGDVAGLARALRNILASAQQCAAMGRQSLDIVARWSFEEDVQGLRAALGI
jgi:glycosyltransferase involved in cell wall biosynthesis